MGLLICNKVHSFVLPPGRLVSNYSEIVVMNTSNRVLYCVFDEFECEARLEERERFTAVPFHPMQSVTFTIGARLTLLGKRAVNPAAFTLHGTMKMLFFDYFPLLSGLRQLRRGPPPVETEVVRSVIHVPAYTPRDFIVRSVAYYDLSGLTPERQIASGAMLDGLDLWNPDEDSDEEEEEEEEEEEAEEEEEEEECEEEEEPEAAEEEEEEEEEAEDEEDEEEEEEDDAEEEDTDLEEVKEE
jgi:flagellar biosynthesis GTPase FlhF